MNGIELIAEERRLQQQLATRRKELDQYNSGQKWDALVNKNGNADGRIDELIKKWGEVGVQALHELRLRSEQRAAADGTRPASLKSLLAYFEIEADLFQLAAEELLSDDDESQKNNDVEMPTESSSNEEAAVISMDENEGYVSDDDDKDEQVNDDKDNGDNL
jgi:hypothetical protein